MNPRRNLSHLAGAAALLVAVLATPGTTTAQDTGRESLLASYHDSSGSLPPPFAGSSAISPRTTPPCRILLGLWPSSAGAARRAPTAPDAIKAVLAAARNSTWSAARHGPRARPPEARANRAWSCSTGANRLPPFPVNDRAR